MRSAFSALFSYRERPNHTPLENFTTELLAFALRQDPKFLNCFLSKIDNQLVSASSLSGVSVEITTQVDFGDSKPDLVITFGKKLIVFVEVKIDSQERENQLAKYRALLETFTEYPIKHLAYLVKINSSKDEDKHQGHCLISWQEVYSLGKTDDNIITEEFLKFLKEKNIIIDMSLNEQDRIVIKNGYTTLKKLDAILDRCCDYWNNENIWIKGRVGDTGPRSTSFQKGNGFCCEFSLAYDETSLPVYFGFDQVNGRVVLGTWIATDTFGPQRLSKEADLLSRLGSEWRQEGYESYNYLSNYMEIEGSSIPRHEDQSGHFVSFITRTFESIKKIMKAK